MACSNFPQCKNTKNINQANHQVDDKGKCPNCGGVVSAKYSKRGKLFFGCDNYPKCDYISWDLPLNENCPICNAQLFKKFSAKGGTTILCNNIILIIFCTSCHWIIHVTVHDFMKL